MYLQAGATLNHRRFSPAAAQEATPVATAATHSSASPTPVQSSGSHSGIILAHGSQCQTAPKSLTCPHRSATAAHPLDRPKFCPRTSMRAKRLISLVSPVGLEPTTT